ncbi:suppressor of cytokine signaling 2 [Corythoichthys intestinalis]|uniref:suppressor of cytokine signaling 2 n=1 Tax=Corythoichthys intestinalis TaxID=161448 RepID=UPI0025A4DA7C|nr:suppressor of cytokine signaling 2 [Corythoichthys intestinalis]XP_061809223.1 suppressor of cytokine signaling 2-like [Nerophis lumbriciformis]
MTCQSSDAVESDAPSDPERRRVASAVKELENAGWYWGALTATEAKEVLRDASEGTFLVRDSSQRDYLFTISAVTSAGPTNLRVRFDGAKFKLDSVLLVRPKLKQFDSVVHLVEHYVQLSRSAARARSAEAPNGTVPLLLTRPAYLAVPPLQHLSRVAINRRTRRVRDLPLPDRLKDYLSDYLYDI